MRQKLHLVCTLLFVLPLSAQDFVRLWSADVPRMDAPRYRHAAAPHQGKVWAIGGQTETGALLTSAESFDPSTNLWAGGTDYPLGLAGMAAVDLGGRLLCMGGEGPAGTFHNLVYELVAGSWQGLTGMNSQRADFACCVHNGELYVFGGWVGASLSSCEKYDSANNQWLPIAPMPTSRHGHQAISVQNRIFILGGANGATALRSTWSYLPGSNSWTTHPSPASDQIFAHVGGTAYVQGTTATLLGGREVESLVLGGSGPHFFACTPMSYPLTHLAAVALGGDVYLTGGRHDKGGGIATHMVQKSQPITLTTTVQPAGGSFPVATTMVHPPLQGGVQYPLLIFGHGYSNTPSDYTQLLAQLAAMGFLVAAPDSGASTLQPSVHATNMKALAENLPQDAIYGSFLTGQTALMGYSIGGGGALLAASQLPASSVHAVAGLAPWDGSLPFIGGGDAVRSAAQLVSSPVLFVQGETDSYPGVGQVLFPLLTSSRRLHNFYRIDDADHGGPGSGGGFGDVTASSDRPDKVLQERTFRYLQSFLRATVLHSPLDPVPVDFDAVASGFDVLVGQPSLTDAELTLRDVKVTDPDLYLLADGPPGQGRSLTLGLTGQANTPYLLGLSLPPEGNLPLPGLGTFLLNPSLHVIFGFTIPAGQLHEMFFLADASVLGLTIHVQGFGTHHNGQPMLTPWRRSVAF